MTNFAILYTSLTSIIIAIITTTLYRYFQKKKRTFQDLLESPTNYVFNKSYLDNIDNNNILLITIDKFCQENNVYKNGAIVSLSGGVDSMVILACLIYLRNKMNKPFPIYAAHINHNLREESNDEVKFLIKYCDTMNVNLYITNVNIDNCSRSEYEESTRNMRFDTYKRIMEEHYMKHNIFDVDLFPIGVFVGHHMDDIVENIFTNSMKGGNILDLEVMKPISTIHDVKLFRPFLSFKKDIIYSFAHTYNVPYFKDTTPEWSKRGKMRNEIFPLLDNVFGKSWRDNIKHLGSQSNDWGQYINDYIVMPWMKEVKYDNTCINTRIIIPVKNQPKIIYNLIFRICLHGCGSNMLKRTSVAKIMEMILNHNKNKKKYITLDNYRIAHLDNIEEKLYIVIELFGKEIKV